MKTKLVTIKNCKECPCVKVDRTEGAGYALDYTCTQTGKLIARVEHLIEEPKDGQFPNDCPLMSGDHL